MKIILLMVMTLDGKITHGDSPSISDWTSKEDQTHFSQFLAGPKLLVMGSNTYLAAKQNMTLQNNKLRVVMTRNPATYVSESVMNQLEFSNASPTQLLQQLEKRGYTEMLLLGGGEINALFFKAKLVNELWLTLEPKIFGKGKPVVGLEELDTNLKLLSSEKLNDQGTLLLHYSIE